MKTGRKPVEQLRFRIRLVLGLMLALHGAILAYLWDLQVVRGHTFQDDIRRQSIRRIRHPGQRGRILDRNGVVLADNRPSYGISLYMEELRIPGPISKTLDHIEALLDELAEKLELPRTLTRRDIHRHYLEKRILPLVAWSDLDETALARWAERVGVRKGVDQTTETVRIYPYHDLLCHSIGYVGRGGMGADDEGPYDFYLPEMEGKAGIELVYDARLRGQAGGELIRIDVAQYKHASEAKRPATAGSDLQLAIDARIQRLCEHVLNQETGSIVVMDPRNGDVLALASYPTFDLNKMVPFISNETWQALNQDPRKPLLNRPVREHYPPGSTIKCVTALSALLSGKASMDTRYTCNGSMMFGNAGPFYCNNRHGHGSLDMREAIERSCNVYFWQLVQEVGYAPMLSMLQELGFGQKTGVQVDYEVPGVLPTDRWKKLRHGDILRYGDVANISIGQGYLNVTPLQLARATAAFANGGTLFKPRLVKAIRDPEEGVFHPVDDSPGRHLGWDPVKTEQVRAAMRDVVMSPRGTARSAQVPGLVYAGKTGTAQYGPRGNRNYRSWMIAFAPYEKPRVAVVVLIDSGDGSGISAAPRMQLIMQALFGEAYQREDHS